MRSNYKKKLFQRVEKIKSSRFSKEKSSFLNIFQLNLVNLFFMFFFFANLFEARLFCGGHHLA